MEAAEFIHRSNIERFQKLAREARDAAERSKLLDLLAAEKRKREEARAQVRVGGPASRGASRRPRRRPAWETRCSALRRPLPRSSVRRACRSHRRFVGDAEFEQSRHHAADGFCKIRQAFLVGAALDAAARAQSRRESGRAKHPIELRAHVRLQARAQIDGDNPVDALLQKRHGSGRVRRANVHLGEGENPAGFQHPADALQRCLGTDQVKKNETADHRVEQVSVGIFENVALGKIDPMQTLHCARRAAVAIACGDRSTPSTNPVSPTSLPAISETSPTPQPRSRTRIPSRTPARTKMSSVASAKNSA